MQQARISEQIHAYLHSNLPIIGLTFIVVPWIFILLRHMLNPILQIGIAYTYSFSIFWISHKKNWTDNLSWGFKQKRGKIYSWAFLILMLYLVGVITTFYLMPELIAVFLVFTSIKTMIDGVKYKRAYIAQSWRASKNTAQFWGIFWGIVYIVIAIFAIISPFGSLQLLF